MGRVLWVGFVIGAGLASSELLGAADEPAAGPPATFEEVLRDMLATLDQITAALAEVKDEESARASRPALQKAAKRFVELRKKADTVKPPNREEKDRLEKEYRPKLFESHKKLLVEIGRVRSVPGGREALQEISAVLNPEPKK